MGEKGVVIELKERNLAVIKMQRTEACAKCRACVAGLQGKEMFIEADNQCKAAVNDWVELEMADNGFYKAVLILYGIPLVGLMAGILLGYFVLSPLLGLGDFAELFSFALGLLCTAGCYFWIRSQESRWATKKYRPIAARITEPEQ